VKLERPDSPDKQYISAMLRESRAYTLPIKYKPPFDDTWDLDSRGQARIIRALNEKWKIF
jgi:hypothetical protein